MSYIQHNPSILSVDILMPCHSTPHYAYLHRPIPFRLLPCPPPSSPHPIDLADVFHSNPIAFMNEMYNVKKDEMRSETDNIPPFVDEKGRSIVTPTSSYELPSHILLYDVTSKMIQSFLDQNSYILEKEFHHTFTPIDHRQSKIMKLYGRII
jgi:hypothetical protein